MKLKNEEEYYEWKNNNKDGYGRMCFTYAERWADMLENLIEVINSPPFEVIKQRAKETSHDADMEGITGFMYGCAVNILSTCWEYGEYLKKWHNNEYDYDGDGVVNPAVLNIKSK